MRRPKRGSAAIATAIGAAIGAALAGPAMSSGVAAQAVPVISASARAAPVSAAGQAAGRAWRLVARRHYGADGNLSGFSAVIAPAKDDAWVFGGTNPGGPGSPTAEHWDGRRWQAVWLPARLSGFIIAASASSARSIWAVSYLGTYVLHWNGRIWTVARRWRSAGTATSIAAISPSDVWVFGDGGRGTWHYDGRSWTRITGAAGSIYRASAVGRNNIWAITQAADGRSVEHYNGRKWRLAPTGPALAGTRPDDILAVSRHDIWVDGVSLARDRLVVVHWNGMRWTRFAAPWLVAPERFAADGKGGIWIPTVTGGLTSTTWILHLTRAGRWSRTKVTAGLFSGVGDLALVPGTRSLWGSGGFLNKVGGDAAIWAHGSLRAPRAVGPGGRR